MTLTELKIHNLRNLLSVNISLKPQFNFIIGPNGSGKTSLLEALYLLSCGRSFRSRESLHLISQGQASFTLFAKDMNQHTISIQKSVSKLPLIKIDDRWCSSTSQLAYALPCQIFYSDIFHIIDAGPAARRSVLDWGLFHVKHNYLNLLKEYKKILKHRSALLKSRAPYSYFVPWDNQLSAIADEIHELREEYFSSWQSKFTEILPKLTDIKCTIRYYKGWDKKKCGANLRDVLEQNFEQDMFRAISHYGCHQADIIIESELSKVKYHLSRGQQKIVLFALKLAQTDLLENKCLYLIDDFSAELDETHQKALLDYFNKKNSQYLITSTSLIPSASNYLENENSQLLYIDKGILSN